MTYTGKNYIAGRWVGEASQGTFKAWQPAQNLFGEQEFINANEAQLNDAIASAKHTFPIYRKVNAEERATFLHAIADEIDSLGEHLIAVTQQETGYPEPRVAGERLRTINQLRAFAQELLSPSHQDITEAGDNNREPIPKPATRLTSIPLGPVAVFGASNFPYAFSTLGGDTAAALAAGCPVIVKAHPAHPATSELMATAIARAIERTKMPAGVFSQLHSSTPELSHLLVKHPDIKAVGFTGSQKVGDLLQKSINERAEPIPFYGELGSTNPQFVLPEKAQQDGGVLAELLCQSLMMGNGQFCTSPGIWIVPESAAGFIESCQHIIKAQLSAPMLTPGILSTYQGALNALSLNQQLITLAEGAQTQHFHAKATLFITKIEHYLANPQLRKEIFGPCAILVTYKNTNELPAIVDALEGQLTASVHGTADDIATQENLVEALSYKVGRLIYNQMPTGVEICASMNHGGPYPACSDIRSTSVGQQAMQRFLRPLCVQNAIS